MRHSIKTGMLFFCLFHPHRVTRRKLMMIADKLCKRIREQKDRGGAAKPTDIGQAWRTLHPHGLRQHVWSDPSLYLLPISFAKWVFNQGLCGIS